MPPRPIFKATMTADLIDFVEAASYEQMASQAVN
jgi:hypothetical protein